MMKKHILMLVMMLVSVAAVVTAQEAKTNQGGPEIVTFKMDGKPFELKHWKHQARAKKGGCTNCHRGEIGKIEGWGKDFAHMICISCHDLDDKGPVQCKECHIK